jgi:hypothetical protein
VLIVISGDSIRASAMLSSSERSVIRPTIPGDISNNKANTTSKMTTHRFTSCPHRRV